MTLARSSVGVRPAVGGELGEVADEVEHHLEHGVVLAGAPDVGILGAEELLGQLEHLGVVVLGEPEDRQDHLQRVVHRDVAARSRSAPSIAAIWSTYWRASSSIRSCICLTLPGLEPVVDEVPVRLVLLAVHLHEALHRRRVRPRCVRSRPSARSAGIGALVKMSGFRSISITSACLVMAQNGG